MWLRVPDSIDDVLWEGPLEPEHESIERLQRSWTGDESRTGAEDVARNLPVVSIGQPEAWPLATIYKPDRMPPLLQARLFEADFYLVRLACSFRPVRRETRIDWARFAIELLPDGQSRQPIADDLHPNEVDQEIQHSIKVSLSPNLKFQGVEASLGGVGFGLEYPELQPRIIAAGHSSPRASWDYSEVPGVAVRGGKWMHLLVKAPKGMTPAVADIYLVADVAARGAMVRALFPNKPTEMRDHLTVRLWG
jgi:hypothetical protein